MTACTPDDSFEKTSFILQRTHVQTDNIEDDYVTDLAFSPNGTLLAIVNRWVILRYKKCGRVKLT
jgi:hypothetical protein